MSHKPNGSGIQTVTIASESKPEGSGTYLQGNQIEEHASRIKCATSSLHQVFLEVEQDTHILTDSKDTASHLEIKAHSSSLSSCLVVMNQQLMKLRTVSVRDVHLILF